MQYIYSSCLEYIASMNIPLVHRLSTRHPELKHISASSIIMICQYVRYQESKTAPFSEVRISFDRIQIVYKHCHVSRLTIHSSS